MIDWIKSIIQTIGYTGIAFLMILENICPPIPSEIIMPFAGFVSDQGELSFAGVVIAGTLGSVAGTLPFYFLGRRIGEDRLLKWTEKYGYWLLLYPRDIVRARKWFLIFHLPKFMIVFLSIMKTKNRWIRKLKRVRRQIL